MNQEFEATIMDAGFGGAYLKVPFDIKKEFGVGRMKVTAFFNGVRYDGSIVNMGVKNSDGSICYIIGIPQKVRNQINKNINDKITVVIRKR